jgi:hypothetical protein
MFNYVNDYTGAQGTSYHESDWEVDNQDYNQEIDEMSALLEGSNSEENLDLECYLHKMFFANAWNTAGRVQDKVDLMEEREKRTLIDNRTYYHKLRGEAIKRMQSWEDQVHLGLMTRKEALNRLYRALGKATKLLNNRKLLLRSGHTWTGMAALKNNILSLLENLGEQKLERNYVKFKDIILDHTYTEEAARQERIGNDWRDEIRTLFYQID